MADPVCTVDGHTYEREAIEHWFYSEGKTTSPFTGLTLKDRTIYPNTFAKKMIDIFVEKKREWIEKDMIYVPQKLDTQVSIIYNLIIDNR